MVFMNNVWTEESLVMLRPLELLDFIRLTNISNWVLRVVTNSSNSSSLFPTVLERTMILLGLVGLIETAGSFSATDDDAADDTGLALSSAFSFSFSSQ